MLCLAGLPSEWERARGIFAFAHDRTVVEKLSEIRLLTQTDIQLPQYPFSKESAIISQPLNLCLQQLKICKNIISKNIAIIAQPSDWNS